MTTRNLQKEVLPEDKVFLKKLGERISSVRKMRGYSSYEEFANKNNLSRAQYGRYEKGKNLNILTLVKLFKALDISPPEFFSEGFN